jgi:uncharacterized membrane protein
MSVSHTRPAAIATQVLAVLGLAVSIYLTITHFDTHVTLVCSSSGGINCEKVTTSPQSYILGIPVAVLGLVYFVSMTVLCLPALWRSTRRSVHLVRLAASALGVAMVLYLISAELFVIRAICLWCTSVHVITFTLFAIIAISTPQLLAQSTEGVDTITADSAA